MFKVNESSIAEDRRNEGFLTSVQTQLGRKMTPQEIQWDAFALRDEAGLTVKEIAEELGKPGTHIVRTQSKAQEILAQTANYEQKHRWAFHNAISVAEDSTRGVTFYLYADGSAIKSTGATLVIL